MSEAQTKRLTYPIKDELNGESGQQHTQHTGQDIEPCLAQETFDPRRCKEREKDDHQHGQHHRGQGKDIKHSLGLPGKKDDCCDRTRANNEGQRKGEDGRIVVVFFCAFFCILRTAGLAALEQHLKGCEEQKDATSDAERGHGDADEIQHSFADEKKHQHQNGGNDAGPQGDDAPLGGCHALGQRQKDRRKTRRVYDDEEGRKDGDESCEFGHGAFSLMLAVQWSWVSGFGGKGLGLVIVQMAFLRQGATGRGIAMAYQSRMTARKDGIYLAYVGAETDLIFTQGVDLPGFASYPLLETDDGRSHLRRYAQELIDLARESDCGAILETPTWVANRDRGAVLGVSPETLTIRNQQAVSLMAEVRQAAGYERVLISANIGPRADAYAPDVQMSAAEATEYHTEQIAALSGSEVDVLSGYTLAYADEATGIVEAAQRAGHPVVISFTVETDGRLPTGQALADAIAQVDAATSSYASYFMINCAHPDHFGAVLSDVAAQGRVKGIVANASRCSHAELDEAEVLDSGDASELGQQLAAIHAAFPDITVLGGCCGTDLRHMTAIARAVRTLKAQA